MRLGAAAWLLLVAVACAHSPRFSPGDLRQTFDLPTVGPVALDVRRLEGKVLLVVFGATDCFACLQGLPRLAQWHDQYASQGLQILWVGTDAEGPLLLLPFANQYALPFPVLVVSGRIRAGASPFGAIRGLPSTALIGRDGVVRAAFEGLRDASQTEALIRRALAE